MEIEEKVHFRQVSGSPRKVQEFRLETSLLICMEEPFLQSVSRLMLIQHESSTFPKPVQLFIHSQVHWEPLLDINMEINWECGINQRSEDPNKHTFDTE